MKGNSLEHKILVDIEKAGFRSEMEVLARLRNSGWNATGLASYFDLDSEISREYDAEGYFVAMEKDGADTILQFFYLLCIEVKKSEKPWVIFAEKPAHDFILSEGFNSPCFFAGIESPTIRVVLKAMAEHSLGHRSGWIGSGIHESFKKPNQSSRWYQALITACKASEHVAKANSWPIKEDDDHCPYAIFAKPVVVLDGMLFSAILDDNGTAKVEEIYSGSVRFSFSTSKYSRGSYVVDVVSLRAFDSYLEIARNRAQGMYKALLAKVKTET